MLEAFSSIALKGIVGGITSAIPVAMQSVVRREAVTRALDGKASTDAVVQKILDDIKIALGSRLGRLTNEVDATLTEFSKAGLFVGLVQAVILKKPAKDIEDAFTFMHVRNSSCSEREAREFYSLLFEAVDQSVKGLVGDKVLSYIVSAWGNRLSNMIENIEHSIRQNLAELNSPSPPSIQFLQDISTRIAESLSKVTIQTTTGLRKANLEEIYVPAHLIDRLPPDLAPHRGNTEDRGSDSDDEFDWGIISSSKTYGSRMSFSEVRSRIHRIVLLGDPGAGKSTFCQYLCLEAAKRFKGGEEAIETIGLPLRLNLREYETARASDPLLDIFAFASKTLVNITIQEASSLASALRYLAVRGMLLVAFDGLDEVLDISKRQKFTQDIANFSRAFPLCAVIVTARFVGYLDAPMDEEFDTFALSRFSDDEVGIYIRKFMSVVGDVSPRQVMQVTREFMERTKEHGGDLRSNPLMLQLMGWLYLAHNGDIPENRPEIYRQCALLMFHKWDSHRGIRPDVPKDFDLLDLLAFLASEIYGEADLEVGVRGTWLEERMRTHFSEIYEDRSRAIASASQLVAFLTGRAWVLSEVGTGIFKFTHRTFLEYFFARYLAAKFDTISELIDATVPLRVKSSGYEPLQLALQMKADSPRTRDVLFSEIIKRLDQEDSLHERYVYFKLLIDALSYVPAPEPTIRKAIDVIADLSLSDDRWTEKSAHGESSLPFPGRAQQFYRISRVCRERREIAIAAAAERLIDKVKSGNIDLFPTIDRLLFSRFLHWEIQSSAIADSFFSGVFTRFRNEVLPLLQAIKAPAREIPYLEWRWSRPDEARLLTLVEQKGLQVFAVGMRSYQFSGVINFLGSVIYFKEIQRAGLFGKTSGEVVAACRAIGRYFAAMPARQCSLAARHYIGGHASMSQKKSVEFMRACEDDPLAVAGILLCGMMLVEVLEKYPNRGATGARNDSFWRDRRRFLAGQFCNSGVRIAQRNPALWKTLSVTLSSWGGGAQLIKWSDT